MAMLGAGNKMSNSNRKSLPRALNAIAIPRQQMAETLDLYSEGTASSSRHRTFTLPLTLTFTLTYLNRDLNLP